MRILFFIRYQQSAIRGRHLKPNEKIRTFVPQ